MINQIFINRIEDLKHHTKTNIEDIQCCCCPMVRDIYLNYQFEYWYDGYMHNIWEDDVQLYAVNTIPYCYDRDNHNVIFQGKLQDLVEQDKVWPFLLFVNGHVIPWSQITIIRDYDYSYIRIDGEVDDFSNQARIVYFPLRSKDIRYGEDEDYSTNPNVRGLYFGADKKLVRDPSFTELSVRFEFNVRTDNIHYEFWDPENIEYPNYDGEEYNAGVMYFPNIPLGKLVSLNNILVFGEDGSFLGGGKDRFEDVDENDEVNTYLKDQFNGAYACFEMRKEFASTNPNILLLYFMYHSDSMSYPFTKDIDRDKVYNNFMLDPKRTAGVTVDEEDGDLKYINYAMSELLFEPFDFQFTRDYTYEQNIRRATKTITRYDYSLWNKVFIDESPIKSFVYSGRDFKKLADMKSYVRFSRKHTDLIEDMAMVFVNGELYEHSIDINNVNNTINIPAFGILDEDVVEVILFTRCNNNILNVRFEDQATPVYIHPEYNLDDCYIMDDQSQILAYRDTPTNPEGRRQYICEMHDWSVDDHSNYKVNFVDASHYNRELKIVPKNQFRYYRFRNIKDWRRIILPQQFNYCHDINRYMVFVNGKKIDRTEFTITIMNRYRPFDQLILYISTILDPNDRVDIFYLPEYLTEKYKQTNLTLKGTLFLETNYPRLYALSKYTTMVFVNGCKINPLDIKDGGMNSMLIDTKYKEIHNVTIMEYIKGEEEIAKYLFGMQGTVGIMGDVTYTRDYKTLKNIVADLLENLGVHNQIGVEDRDFSKYIFDQWTFIMDLLCATRDPEVDSIINRYENGADIIYELFNELKPEDVKKNYKDDYLPLRAVLYDIIVDYYVQRNGVTTGDDFVYDFEVQEWNQDREGNYDITLYPDHDKMFDYQLDVETAQRKDVLSGKKFYPA